jgi:hypothetical protein
MQNKGIIWRRKPRCLQRFSLWTHSRPLSSPLPFAKGPKRSANILRKPEYHPGSRSAAPDDRPSDLDLDVVDVVRHKISSANCRGTTKIPLLYRDSLKRFKCQNQTLLTYNKLDKIENVLCHRSALWWSL